MSEWFERYLSTDDLLSLGGYALLLLVNRFRAAPLPFPLISLLASGMLAIVWMASGNLRARNRDRKPNLRVAFWGLVAVASLVGAIL